MEMALKIGTFEALNQQEMMMVDGGNLLILAFGAAGVYAYYRGFKYLYELGYQNGYYSTKG